MAINPIHISGTMENEMVTRVQVVIYYPAEMPREEILDDINESLGHSCTIVSAYELISDGFGNLIPDDAPLA